MVFMLCISWRAAAAPMQHHAQAWAEGLGDWVDSWIAEWLAEMLAVLMDGLLACGVGIQVGGSEDVGISLL